MTDILDHIPALQPPPGVVSNFIDPPSRALQTRVITYITLPLMVIFLSLRLYTRARITRSFGVDDYLAVASAICTSGYCGLLLWLLKGPTGFHKWDVPISHVKDSFWEGTLAAQVMYLVAALFVKAALLVLYLRIFRPSNRARVMIWVGIILSAFYCVALAIAQGVVYRKMLRAFRRETTLLASNPALFHGPMSSEPPPGYSTELDIISAQGILGVITDFYILFIPMHLIVGLHLPLGRKIGVCGIFLTGLIACISSIMGTVFRFQARSSVDTMWAVVPWYTLSVVELNFGIICSCMPVVFVLFKRIAKNESVLSALQYVRRRRSKVSTGESEQDLDLEKLSPAFPKPTMTGLRSFIWKAHRSQCGQTIASDLTIYDELSSAHDDYHMQLKAAK